MPSIEEWKKKNKELLKAHDEFQADPSLDRSYKLIRGLAGMMTVVAGLLLPQTQALKIIIIALKGFSGFLKSYAEKKNNI
jgi:hypothetical protein